MPSTTPQQPHYCPWGYDISSPKPNNTTRLYYKNTNGIRTRAFTNGLTTLYQHHREIRIDIFLYTETNTDWQQPTTKTSQRNTLPTNPPQRHLFIFDKKLYS
jgi:hypothetical protein